MAQAHAFIEYCFDTGRVDRDEVNLRFVKLLTDRMKEARFDLIRQMANSPIVGPNGQPLDLKRRPE